MHLHFHMNFVIILTISERKTGSWNLYRDCIECVGQFGDYCHLKNITVVHLHNGTLCSRKKEGISIFSDSMDGTGEHYAK